MIKNLQSKNRDHRYTAASSFKYFCTKSTQMDKIQELVNILIKMVNDEDITVRRAVLLSLNSIIYYIPKTFRYSQKKKKIN